MDYSVMTFVKDPFVHFIIIGVILFSLYEVNNDDIEDRKKITISKAQVSDAIKRWEQRWQRLPSDSELHAVIEQKIRHEVFYREALALNLDKDDPVVHRRLAEKMMFLSNDLMIPTQASNAQLTEFMQQSPELFSKPVLSSFQHIYFNSDIHDVGSKTFYIQAEKTRQKLNSDQIVPSNYKSISDDFHGSLSIEQMPTHQISRIFGQQFAHELTQAPIGQWYGPISSGYGQHLVKLEYRSKAELIPLADIKDKVLANWKVAQQKQSNDSLYKSLKSNYDIVIEQVTLQKGN